MEKIGASKKQIRISYQLISARKDKPRGGEKIDIGFERSIYKSLGTSKKAGAKIFPADIGQEG